MAMELVVVKPKKLRDITSFYKVFVVKSMRVVEKSGAEHILGVMFLPSNVDSRWVLQIDL